MSCARDWRCSGFGHTVENNGHESWGHVILTRSALRKTAYLLTALSDALPISTKGETTPAPINYHPLDLSHPELHRVLGEMNDAFGDKLKGKVDCIGLHGDYEAGLQFIREGKLGQLRSDPSVSHTAGISENAIEDSPELAPTTVTVGGKRDDSPDSAEADHIATPPEDTSPLPSAITDTSSEMSKLDSGTWSPLDDSVHIEGKAPATQTSTTPPRKETDRPLHLVFLGSSLGNFEREGAAPFLKSLPLRQGDTLLLGLDGRPAPGEEGRKKVEVAYNDPAGHTRAFEEHGWEVVRDEIGLKGDAGVEFVGRYNEELGGLSCWLQTLHQCYVRKKKL